VAGGASALPTGSVIDVLIALQARTGQPAARGFDSPDRPG
jgi:hypothetical protein